jgi:hypothetical protein
MRIDNLSRALMVSNTIQLLLSMAFLLFVVRCDATYKQAVVD